MFRADIQWLYTRRFCYQKLEASIPNYKIKSDVNLQ